MTPSAREVNVDGLPGPTHTFGGLAYGNLASMEHRSAASNPKAAALQGLEKMKRLRDLGVPQAVFPPHDRPNLTFLRKLGFTGDDREMLEKARREDAHVFLACYSSSGMWAANAATVAPSADTADGRVHFTPANLVSQVHRALETPLTSRILKTLFNDERYFVHHSALPRTLSLADEGSANHLRLCRAYGGAGIEVFVHGRKASGPSPSTFPARQTMEASMAVARLHRLDLEATIHIQQNPQAIDEGVFHNDVICVGDRNVLLYHAEAFLEGRGVVDRIRKVFVERCKEELIAIEIEPARISVPQAVQSYLFNSQLVTGTDDTRCLIAPLQCLENRWAKACLDQLVEDPNPICAVHYVDLSQSMANGGGPACLRLRVVLTDEEQAHMHQSVILTDGLYDRLVSWVKRHYRDRLTFEDLMDPALIEESRRALDELTGILQLGALYDFQLNELDDTLCM